MSKVRGIPSMTGIRGMAALWVMLYHAQQNSCVIFSLPRLGRIPVINSGWRGVDLFFMLSGFILMYAHGADFRFIRKESLFRFTRLRFLRIYPLNAVVLLLIAVLVAFQPGFAAWQRLTFEASDFTLVAFLRTLFLATRWFLPGSGDWNQPVWALSLEILGYVIFPWLAFGALRIVRKWQLIALAALCLAGSLAVLATEHLALSVSLGQITVVRMAACLVAGMAMQRLWALDSESANKWAGWITAVSVLGLFLAALLPLGGLAFNFLFASLLYGLAFQQGAINRFLSSRLMVFFGGISFPLYLIHVIPLLWLRYFLQANGAAYSPLQKSAALACWAIGCILAATLLHSFVEKPFHALGRKWAGERVSQ
jgi:peptidoglycan/LPS O-acetylase OafA/YrhL